MKAQAKATEAALAFSYQYPMTLAQRLKARNAHVLLSELESGKSIPSDRMMNVLGTDRWKQLQDEISSLREGGLTRQAIPQHIKNAMRPYIERLAKADRLEYLAGRARQSSKPSAKKIRQMRMLGCSTANIRSSKEMYRRNAEAAYEQSLEKLQEIIDEFPTVVTCLDRIPIFEGEHCNVSPDPAGVPRLQSSRSRYNIAPRAPRQSIRSLRIEAVRDLIRELVGSPQQ